jgi:nitrite reductase/ring-hydroxylating ferredoxin subunit
MGAKSVLCELSDLPEFGSARLPRNADPHDHGLCVVRQSDRVFAYLNRCPHTLAPLDWEEGDFLDWDGELIVCSWHGARFRIEDGYCVSGPCAGQSLTPQALRLEAGQVLLASD